MPIRHPPDDHIPRIARRGPQPPARVVGYQEPRPTFRRRFLRFLTRPYIAVPAIVAFTLCAGVLIYYWVVFSARIDTLLQGEVFTRSAGIYAAPKQIRAGQGLSQQDLVGYLRRAGYVEKGHQAESARGRYGIDGSTVEIQPGTDAMLDSMRAFEPLRVQFTRDGKAISGLTTRDSGARLIKHNSSRN